MKHISVEGMDGVGKTTVCRLLARELGYKFVEKPLHYILDESEDDVSVYRTVARRVNASPNRDFTAWYYGLNNIYLYEKFKDMNIVTDRHIVSNYCWSGAECNGDIYDLILKKIGKQTLTVILYARTEIIETRLLGRNREDSNLSKVAYSEQAYKRMTDFCKEKQFPHIIVDTSDKFANEVAEEILSKIGEYGL